MNFTPTHNEHKARFGLARSYEKEGGGDSLISEREGGGFFTILENIDLITFIAKMRGL